MTTEQLTTLLSLYKKAVANSLTVGDFKEELKQARLDLDSFFVHEGKESMDIEEYLNELIELQKAVENE